MRLKYLNIAFLTLTALAALAAVASCSSSTATKTTTAPPTTTTAPPTTTGVPPTTTTVPPTTTTVAPTTTTALPTTATPPATTTQPPGQPVTVTLTAQSLSFDKSSITVPSGAQVTISFNNNDSGIPHNFSLYADSNMTQSLYIGKIINGPATTTYTFTAPSKAGTYFFRCDVHPTQMTGTFIVQ